MAFFNKSKSEDLKRASNYKGRRNGFFKVSRFSWEADPPIVVLKNIRFLESCVEHRWSCFWGRRWRHRQVCSKHLIPSTLTRNDLSHLKPAANDQRDKMSSRLFDQQVHPSIMQKGIEQRVHLAFATNEQNQRQDCLELGIWITTSDLNIFGDSRLK